MKDICKKEWQDTTATTIARYGAEYASNENLIAAVLGIDMMSQANQPVRDLLSDNRSLLRLSNKTFDELTKIKGIGDKKAAALLASFELGRRMMKEKSEAMINLDNSLKIYEYIKPYIVGNEYEEAYLLISNNKFNLIKCVKIGEGGITETAIDIRRIIKETVTANGTIISLVHNHPSNSTTPSKPDDNITFSVKKACDIMRIFFQDHIIIASDGSQYYSYHDKGRL